MKPVNWDSGVKWGDPNLRWGDPSYLLEPGDPGYTPPFPPPKPKPTKKGRKYMASNSTPTRLDELIAAGEDLCDGLNQHAATIGILQNTFAAARADLDALIAAQAAFVIADGAKAPAYAGLRTAESNAKGFITRALNVLRNYLGNDWSDLWIPTGLPDNTVGMPRTQDGRFTALTGLKAYFTAVPSHENAPLNVTAAIATTLHAAFSDARVLVGNALSNAAAKIAVRDVAREAFRERFRGTINELEQRLSTDDARWYDFGLNRPDDPATPGIPSNVIATALGSGRVLVQIDGARRANSFNYYKQVVGTDAEPVKVINTEGTQHTIESLPAGATVKITVTGVNDAGEGQASEAVSVSVT